MKKLTLSILLTSVCLILNAQSDIDALRYSSTDIGLTARGLGSGGAFGALGADLSSAGINPAGLALYRSNSFILGVGMLNSKSTASYLNNSVKDNEFNLNIPNLGVVFHNKKYNGRKPATNGWLNTNFAISFNRTNNFNKIVNYSGENNSSSMLDYFAERSDGLSVSELGASDEELSYGYNDIETMAWEAYLIDSVGIRQYGAAIQSFDRSLSQRNIISSKGSMNDINLTISANYENKFYLGGGIDITTVKYKETNQFTETDLSSNMNNWSVWKLERNLTTTGVGVSGSLGLIVRPDNHLRFGASLRTPTIFSLNDEYSDNLSAAYDDGGSLELKSSNGSYDYKVISPLKTTLSAAYIFGKSGFISADVEFVDYSTMRLRPVIDAFEVANDLIRTKYKNTANIRVGGEYRHEMFRFRAGAAQYGSPLANSVDGNLKRTYITGGIGIKENDWALDLALVQKRGTEIYQPYSLNAVQVDYATNKLKNNFFVLTLSTSF
jgi:hypothetical protein